MHFSRLLDFEDIYSEWFDSSPFHIQGGVHRLEVVRASKRYLTWIGSSQNKTTEYDNTSYINWKKSFWLCSFIHFSWRTRTRPGRAEQQNELWVCVFVVAASWRAASPGNAYLSCSVDKIRTTNKEWTPHKLASNKKATFFSSFCLRPGFCNSPSPAFL